MPEGKSGAGHLAIALNIAAFRPLEAFNEDMEMLVSKIKNTARAPGTNEIFYPGELEARAEERQVREGVSIPDDTVAELDAGARELSIATLSSLRKATTGG